MKAMWSAIRGTIRKAVSRRGGTRTLAKPPMWKRRVVLLVEGPGSPHHHMGMRPVTAPSTLHRAGDTGAWTLPEKVVSALQTLGMGIDIEC